MLEDLFRPEHGRNKPRDDGARASRILILLRVVKKLIAADTFEGFGALAWKLEQLPICKHAGSFVVVF